MLCCFLAVCKLANGVCSLHFSLRNFAIKKQTKIYAQNKAKQRTQRTHIVAAQRPDLQAFENKIEACAAAEKIMKHAFSAMKFNDVATAMDKLQEALAILAPHRNS